MQIKRYEVATINEAIGRIKQDLGPDAVILSARKIRSGAKQAFEVTAACDPDPKPKNPVSEGRGGNRTKEDVSESGMTSLRRELDEIRASLATIARDQSLRIELAEMKETLNHFFDVVGMRRGRTQMDDHRRLYLHLKESGFSQAAACRIIEAVNAAQSGAAGQAGDLFEAARRYIQKTLPADPTFGAHKRVQFFLGPTGVGKTTTLAKLAARYAMVEKKKVGLINTDNYRIAAAEQLGTYAKIMGLPVETATTAEAFGLALKKYDGLDVILVDTPGRANPDGASFRKLVGPLKEAGYDAHLLISAAGDADYLKRVVDQYEAFDVRRMLITKTDEAIRFGGLYDVIGRSGRPVSFVTCGQNVPQDIREATPGALSALIFGNPGGRQATRAPKEMF